jgi:hypothetical protein
VALLFHFAIIHKFRNLAWPDEIFQTLEQGHRLAFGYGIIPWEFRDGVRSWFLPGILGGVMRVGAFLGGPTQGYLVTTELFLALASVVPVAVAMAWAKRAGLPHPWIAAAACATWFELVFFSGKALAEVFAAYAVAPAVLLSVIARESGSKRALLAAGAFWALAVGLRLHIAPAALVAFVWVARRDWHKWAPLLAGGAVITALFGLLDWVTWSYPFQSSFLNFWTNIVKGKASWFGESPPSEYVISLLQTWGWTCVPLVGLGLFAFRRYSLLWLTALTILVSHSAIAHKEYRFLAPMLMVLVISASLGLLELVRVNRPLGYVACAVWLVASADGARRFDWRTLAPRPAGFAPSPMWSLREGAIRAYESMRADPNVCGVASLGWHWAWTGGYTYLHRNVPIFQINDGAGFRQYSASFNAILTHNQGASIGPFVQKQCWQWLCLYQRVGGCEPPGSYNINQWLAEHKM